MNSSETNPLSTNQTLLKTLAFITIYLLLRFAGGGFGEKILYPINMLVTFLHELGHATGALLSGGKMKSMDINLDGSGLTTTLGGSTAITLVSGYIGSAIFGNLLFYIGAKLPRFQRGTLVALASLMVFAGVFWYTDWRSTAILLLFAALLYFISRRVAWAGTVLMFLGVASVMYIIQDFNQGPSSDLAHFEAVVGIFPASIWKYIWLFFVVLLFLFNIRLIFSWQFLKKITW
jgi:hypothetical protein